MSYIDVSMIKRRASGQILVAFSILAALAGPVNAQEEPTLVRGTINYARDGGMIGLVMEVTTDERQTAHIYLKNAFKVVRIEPASIGDIAIGERVAVSDLDGEAGVVWHLIGGDLSENHRQWHLAEGTELVVGVLETRTDDSLTVSTSDGELAMEIGPETVVVASAEESSTMSWLHEGLPVVVIAEIGQDGTFSTDRIYTSQSIELPL